MYVNLCNRVFALTAGENRIVEFVWFCYDADMNTHTLVSKKSGGRMFSIPVTLEQIAQGIRKLSRAELNTLEILLDPNAAKTIRDSMRQAQTGLLKKIAP